MSGPMGSMSADMRGLKAKLKRYDAKSREGRIEGAKDLARMVVDQLLILTPVDTGTLRNGWRTAAVRVQLGAYPLERVQESRYMRRWVRQLSKQYRRWEGNLQAAIKRGDSPKEIKRLQKLRDKAFTDMGKFFQERDLENFSARVMWAKDRTLNFSVRTKVYGGEGVIVEEGNTATVLLKNKEPHASLVEKQKRPLAKATTMARQIAGAKLRKLMLRKLKAGEGKAAA